MRNQNHGISQPSPRQQQEFNEMQLWKQQLMYKHMQEIQRQRQLHQLDLREGQQNLLSQLSNGAKQVGIEQSLPVLHGMPVNNASNSMWSGDLVGGDSKTMNNSLMFLGGNVNWTQQGGPSVRGFSNGLMFSHDQGQTIRPMGFSPHSADQYLYETPLSGSRYSFNHHHSQSQGTSHDWSDEMNRASENSGDKASMQQTTFNYHQNNQFVVPENGSIQHATSDTKQCLPGKSLFGSAPLQGLHSGAVTGNFPHGNYFSQNVQVQQFQDGQRDKWSGKTQVNKLPQVGPSCVEANLDCREEKLLFGTDKGRKFNGSFEESDNKEKGAYKYADPFENSDKASTFPSTQSGSWSALMLDALEASSSDTGLQEELSGLSLHRAESSTGNPSGKQQVALDDKNLQSSSCLTSRPLPLFNDTSASPTCLSFRQSTKFAYEENEKVAVDVSRESSQQSSKEANCQQLGQRHHQIQLLGNNLHGQAPSNSVSKAVWPGQMHGLSASNLYSAGMEFGMPNMQVWDQQLKVLPHNGSSMIVNKLNDWNSSQSLGPRGYNTSDAPSNDDIRWHAQRNDTQRTMHLENDHDGNMWRVRGNQVAASFPSSNDGHESEVVSSKIHSEDSYAPNFTAVTGSNGLKLDREMKQQVAHRHQLDFGEHVALGFSTNYKGDGNLAHYHDQLNKDSQDRDKNKGPNENFDHVRENSHMTSARNDGYIPDKSDPSHHTESGAMKSYLLAGNDYCPLVYSNQKFPGQSGQKSFGPHMFQHHPMVKVERGVEPVGWNNQQLYSRPSCQSAVKGLENQEHEHAEISKSTGQTLSRTAVSFGKEHLTVSQKDIKVENEQSRGITTTNASVLSSFDGSATHISHDQMIDQRSPNMLELLDKVDQGRNNSTVFSFLDRSVLSEIPEAAVSDDSACLQHEHSSALQGFGLKLGPPSQRQSVLDHNVPSEASFQTDGQIHDSGDKALSHQYAQTSLPFVLSKISPFRFTPSVDSAASQFHSSSLGFSQQINASPDQICSNQQFPVVEARSAEQSSAPPAISRTGGFANMLNNVGTKLSAQQRASLIQSKKIIPRPPESMSPLPCSININSWVPQKADDQRNITENPPSEFGTCFTNSQFIYGEENLEEGNSLQNIPFDRVDDASKTNDASQGQEPVLKRSSDENSRVHISSLFHCHQQDLTRGKHADNLSLDSQKEHTSMPNSKQNYSLLQQVQSMKGIDSDPSRRAIKRIKGADFRADKSKMDCAVDKGSVYGHNTVAIELDATFHDSSLPSDVKMLSFLRENEDESVGIPSQIMDREKPSRDLITSGEQNLQTHSLSKHSTLTFCRGEHPKINSLVALSGFEQYGINKNVQVVARNDGNGNSHSTSKNIGQHHIFTKVVESKDNDILVEQRDGTTQIGCVKQITPSIPLVECSSSLRCIPSNGIYNSMTLIPKKRKTATSELRPWHKEVMEGSKRLHVASNAERAWDLVTNRLKEKLEHETKMIEDATSINQPRSRLILTTELMQQLLPSIPAAILSADATASYESITYFISKLVLGDAFSLISCPASNSLFLSDTGNKIFEYLKSSKKDKDHIIVKTMEEFTGRSRKLESDLSRLQKSSMLDVRLECHDLDKFSIINRFAKFHDRTQTDRIVGSAISEYAPRRIFPQRHVTMQAVTGNIPDGVRCLSL